MEDDNLEIAVVNFEYAIKEYYKSKLESMRLDHQANITWWNDVVAGAIVGKNEKERDAVFYENHSELMTRVMEAREKELERRGEFEIAKLKYGYFRFIADKRDYLYDEDSDDRI